MFFESNASMCNLNFLKKNIINATYSSTLEDNTFTYNDTTNIIEHKKVDTAKGGQYFCIPLEHLQVGDMIVLELDYMKVSGTNINIVYRQGNAIKENFKLNSNGEFNTYSYSFIVTQNIAELSSQNRLEIGYATAEAGQYKLRDVSIKLKRRKDFNNSNNNTILGGMFYKTPSNSFIFHEGFINDLNFEIVENTIRVKFKNSTKRVLPVIQPLGLGNTSDYIYKIILIQNAYFDFQILNKTDNSQVVLSTLTNKEIWLSIGVIAN